MRKFLKKLWRSIKPKKEQKIYVVDVIDNMWQDLSIRLEGTRWTEGISTNNGLDHYRRNGIHPGHKYLVSNEHIPNAMALRLHNYDFNVGSYRAPGSMADLCFCDRKLNQFFGEVPLLIWFKEVPNE